MNDNGWYLEIQMSAGSLIPLFSKQAETKERRLAMEEKKRLEEDKAKVTFISYRRSWYVFTDD